MMLIHILLSLILAITAHGQITAAPEHPIHADPWQSKLQKRAVSTFCDINRKFYCFTPATCVYGQDGYVGCCSALGTTCAPRPRCIEYTTGSTPSCDYVTGGCVYCSNPGRPFCTKQYMGESYVLGCGTSRLTTTYAGSGSGILVEATETAAASTSELAVGSYSSSGSSSSSSSASAFLPLETSSVDHLTGSSSVGNSVSVVSTFPSASQSPSQAANTSVSTDPGQNSSLATSRGLIIGVVIGAAAGSVLLLVSGFLLWKYWKRRELEKGRVSREKASNSGYSLGTGGHDATERDNSQHDINGGPFTSQGPAELEESSSRGTAVFVDGGHARSDENGLQSHAHHETPPYSPEDIHGAAEAPASVPAWSSPTISTMASPTPFNLSMWQGGPVVKTPRPSSQYVAYSPFTPSSDYSGNGQPPSSLPQVRHRGGHAPQETPLVELDGREIGRAQ